MGDIFAPLITAVQRGSKSERDRAFAEIERLLRPMLLKLAQERKRRSFFDADDYYQAGLIAVYELAQRWDESKAFKATFRQQANTFAMRRMVDFVRRHSGRLTPSGKMARRLNATNRTSSIETTGPGASVYEISDDRRNPVNEAMRNEWWEGLPERIAAMSNLLSERQSQILGLFAKGYSTDDVAEQLGINRATVESFSSLIRKKLGIGRRFLGENNGDK